MASAQQDSDDAIMGINVTPLVDITLVLLIIFMATAHMIVHRSMSLNLPKVAHSEAVPTQSLQIQLDADRSVSLNGQKVTLPELAVNMGQMAKLDPGLRVTVSADERVSWGDVAAILDVLRGAGVTKIATEVQPKRGT